jgi:Fe2+ transport system protein FeoA
LPQVGLDKVTVGYEGSILAVKSNDPRLLQYLDKIGAHPGKRVKVLSKEHYDDSLEVTIDQARHFVSREVSQNILVSA